MKTQKYVTIANILRNKILSGEYPVKSKLPYEREMIAKFKASKMTIKKATDILVDEGMITKIKAKGTFVNDFAEGSLDGIECEQCGALIRTGRFCDSCKAHIQNNLMSAIDKPKAVERKKPTHDKDRMRFLQN